MESIFSVHPVVVGMRIVTKITGMIYNSAERSRAPPCIVLSVLSVILLFQIFFRQATLLTTILPRLNRSVWKSHSVSILVLCCAV